MSKSLYVKVAALLWLIGFASLPPVAIGKTMESAIATYQHANSAYLRGDWDGAIAGYEELLGRGLSHADLHYNLGNAYFRSGRLGWSIYHYERALRLDPGHVDAAYNNAIARTAVAEKWRDRLQGAELQPLWIRVVTFFPIGAIAMAFFALNLAFFAALIAIRFVATGLTRTALVVASGFAGSALALTVVLFAGHIYYLERVRVGIVLGDEVQMREGADERSRARALIHAGLTVEVRARRGEWLLVRLANDHEAWVPAGSIGEL